MTPGERATPLRAVIIGCGAVAGGYDDPTSERVETHAHAYLRHPEIDLVAAADPDQARLDAFSEKWGVTRRYVDGVRMLADTQPDIVSICAPTDTHADWLATTLIARPRAVWCEKPIAARSADARPMVAAYADAGIPLAVNYLRRWDHTLDKVAERCRRDPGQVRVVVHYGKGLFNNGSHALDLLLDWLGPVRACRALSVIQDFTPDDPTVSAHLAFASGAEVWLAGNDSRRMTIWEMDVIGPGWRQRLTDSGNWLHEYLRDDARGPIVQQTTLGVAMLAGLDEIVNAVSHGTTLRSTGATALETLQLCERVRSTLTPELCMGTHV